MVVATDTISWSYRVGKAGFSSLEMSGQHAGSKHFDFLGLGFAILGYARGTNREAER